VGKYDDMLAKIQVSEPRRLNDNILVIDAMNTFIRNFTMINLMNPQGSHVGGLVGFLKSLGFLVRTFDPTRIIIVFDGPGSTAARKLVNSDYKANRNLSRITNWEMYDNKDQEYASMSAQIERLVEYLHMLPVDLLAINKVEADDVIAFIAKEFSESKVTIVSSDKDFMQVVNDNVRVHSPIKKKNYGPAEVLEEQGVLPSNYLIVKALLGDNSDNLQGVKGLGIKGVLKHFPNLASIPNTDLDYVYEVCEEGVQKTKILAKILERKHVVDQNYGLMNLMEPQLSDTQISIILDVLGSPCQQLNATAFMLMLQQDNIQHGITKNTESWLETFRYILTVKK
jgi:DNA polymerase-1